MLASSPELIEEVKKAPDDILSTTACATNRGTPARTLDLWSPRFFQLLQSQYTLGLELENEYHVDILRSKLTRNLALNLAVTFKEVHDEVMRTFDASTLVRGDGT